AGQGELVLSGFQDNNFTGITIADDGQLTLNKVGLFTNAIAISGSLVVGGSDMTKSPRAVLFADDEINPTLQVVVNRNAKLLLSDHHQTVGGLAVNGGVVDSGDFGVLKLAGGITSTNTIVN